MKKTPGALSGIILEAVNQSTDAVFITDPKGAFEYVNPAFEKLTGYSAAEVIGKNANILKSGEHPPEFYENLWKTLSSGKPWKGRFRNRRKDGTLSNDESHITPVKDASGKIAHFISFRHDISRELVLEDQLRQGQKLESLGLLAGQVAHDFNNLLTIIIGATELVMDDIKPSAKTSKTLAMEMLKTSKQAAGMIKQLLIFARRQDAQTKVMELNPVLDEMRLILENLLSKKIKVFFDLAPGLPMVRIEADQIKQVVINLAVNARDAMPDGGELRVSTSSCAVPPDTLLPLKPGGYVCLEVRDTGAGVPKDIQSRIFEPFFTTKPKGKGTGLGLSTSYGIVKQHGGEIVVESEPGKGAAFRIYFPEHR